MNNKFLGKIRFLRTDNPKEFYIVENNVFTKITLNYVPTINDLMRELERYKLKQIRMRVITDQQDMFKSIRELSDD